jgi:hypothetical protein
MEIPSQDSAFAETHGFLKRSEATVDPSDSKLEREQQISIVLLNINFHENPLSDFLVFTCGLTEKPIF